MHVRNQRFLCHAETRMMEKERKKYSNESCQMICIWLTVSTILLVSIIHSSRGLLLKGTLENSKNSKKRKE